MVVEQQRAPLFVAIICVLAAAVGLIAAIGMQDNTLIAGSAAGLLIFSGLAMASRYRRPWAPMAIQLCITLLASAVLVVDAESHRQVAPAVFIPPVMAMVLADQWGVASAGLIAYIAPALASGSLQNPYLQPFALLTSLVVIMGMSLSRLLLNGLITRSRAAEQAANAAERTALREATLAQERAAELEQRAREQERLIELIGTLEMPLVSLADGLLLVPLIGHLDTRRLQTISARLLDHISQQRVPMVILDLAGVALIDSQVALHIQRMIGAIGLLGAEVCLTGIRAEVAAMMTSLNISLQSAQIARSPQEVIARAGRRAAG